jgi:hypothetical protein
MKKILGIIFTSLLVFNSALPAQVCDGVSAEAIPLSPQTGSYNYFGVRVTLSQTYDQDVTVTGYIFAEGSPNQNKSYTLTITAGNLTTETDVYFFQTGPADGAGVEISSVTPCPYLAARIAGHQRFIQLNLLFDEVLDMPTPDTFIVYFDTAQLRQYGDEYLSEITGFQLSAITTMNESLIESMESFMNSFPELEGLSEELLTNILSEAVEIYLANQNRPVASLSIPGGSDLRNILMISMAGRTLFNSSFIKRNKSSTNNLIAPKGLTKIKTKDVFQEMLSRDLSNISKLSLSSESVLDPCSDCKKLGRLKMASSIALGVIGCSGGGIWGIWACSTIGFYVAGRETLVCMKQNCPQQ